MALQMTTSRSADILVVEDDSLLRQLLRIVLTREGYRVELTKNGQEAVDFLTSGGTTKVILLDMMMPVMDGLRFLAWLGEHPDISDRLRVVVLSAYALDNETDRDLHNLKKVSAIINKPVVVTRLLETLHQTLQTDA
jgi:CheY-like chemotaxis protein